jgi:hypothetical protein
MPSPTNEQQLTALIAVPVESVVKPLWNLTHYEEAFLSFLVFLLHQYGGHTLHCCFLSPLSLRVGDWEGGHFLLLGGKIPTRWWPLWHHNSRDCYTAPAHDWNSPDAATSSGCRGHTGRRSSVTQQPTVDARFPISRKSSSTTTLISSSSRPSTLRTMREGGRSRR